MDSRVFPDFYPRLARDHMPPPPLPPRCQKPAFCLSAVKWRVFIDATAILRCARFQLLRCVAPKTRCLPLSAQLQVCCGDPHGKTKQNKAKNLQASKTWSFGILPQETHANSESHDKENSSPGQSHFIRQSLSPTPLLSSSMAPTSPRDYAFDHLLVILTT